MEKKKTAPRPKASRARAKAADSGDWRAATLERVRALMKEADPSIVEEWKWRKPSNAMTGVPVWSCAGILCTGETYKDKVKLTFAKGAVLKDPKGLFNAGREGYLRRAIDLRAGDRIDEKALVALIRAAAALNKAVVADRLARTRGARTTR